MHRTQIYLEREQYELLKSQARREGRTIAAVIRAILDRHLGRGSKRTKHDPFEAVVGIGRGDGSAVAENYEDYLYGDES